MSFVPAMIPGVREPYTAGVLQPRWTRARALLIGGLVACPVGIVVVASAMVAIGGAVDGFRGWMVLAIAGSALPAFVLIVLVPRKVTEPQNWLFLAVLVGASQFLLGGIAAIAAIVPAAPAGSAVGMLLLATLIGTGCVLSHRAMKVLLWPLRPELGRTRFAIPLRARIKGPGLIVGTIVVARDGVEWRATSRGLVGRARAWSRLGAEQIIGARPATLPANTVNHPWLRLSSGAMVTARPGPIMVLAARSGEYVFPVQDAVACAELLRQRIGSWRGVSDSR